MCRCQPVMIGRVHRRVQYFAGSHWEGGLAWGSVRSEKRKVKVLSESESGDDNKTVKIHWESESGKLKS